MPGNIYMLIDFRMRVLMPKSATDMSFKFLEIVTSTNLLEPCSTDCSSPGYNPRDLQGWVQVV